MPSMTSEQFHEAVLTRYNSVATEAHATGVVAQLDESLRESFAKLWNKVLLLEALTIHLPTGDLATIRQVFHDDLDQLIESWQQSLLSHPRVKIAGNDPEFRSKVMQYYSTPCDDLNSAEIAKLLDDDLASVYVIFWELKHQLHLCAKELARTHDSDLAELTKQNLKAVVGIWKESLLKRPRASLVKQKTSNE